MFSERVEQALRKAGWYPGRKIDIREGVDRLQAEGYTVPQVLRDFLTEFGGLKIETPGHPPYNILNLDLKETLGGPIVPMTKREIYEPRIEEDLIIFGEIWGGHDGLAMSASGKLYVFNCHDLSLLGNNYIEMFENLYDSSFRPQELPLFSKRAEQALRKGGWYPERETDCKKSIRLLKEEGYPIPSDLIDFLYQYDGLKIAMLDRPPYNEINIDVTGTRRNPAKKKKKKQIYEPRIKDYLVIFGEIWGVLNSLAMSAALGKMYAKIGEKLYFLGYDYIDMIENLSDPEFRPQEIH